MSVIVVLHLVSKNENPSYKLAWAIPIMLFPLFGGFFYIIAGNNRLGKKFTRRLEEVYRRTVPFLKQDESIMEELEQVY